MFHVKHLPQIVVVWAANEVSEILDLSMRTLHMLTC